MTGAAVLYLLSGDVSYKIEGRQRRKCHLGGRRMLCIGYVSFLSKVFQE